MAYPGGKGADGTFQFLINLMPPMGRYFEPFAGDVALLRNMRPPPHSYAWDKNPKVVQKLLMDRAAGRLPATLTVLQGDALQLLQQTYWHKNDLVFADPPYLPATRSSQKRLYEFELDEPEQHEELLCTLCNLPCLVMVTHYESELYRSILRPPKWHAFSFMNQTRGGRREEWVWCNYPRPLQLHDYRWIGDDYKERWNYRKRQRRWVDRLARMSHFERLAMFAAMDAYREAAAPPEPAGGDEGGK